MKNALKLTFIPAIVPVSISHSMCKAGKKDFLQCGFYRLNEWGYAAKTTRYSDIFRKINFCIWQKIDCQRQKCGTFTETSAFSLCVRFPIRICHMVPQNISFSPYHFIIFHVTLIATSLELQKREKDERVKKCRKVAKKRK